MSTLPYTIEATDITFACADGFAMPALLAAPCAPGRYPGLLFIGEPFGLNAEMRRIAAVVAAAGYVVLAPDLASRGPWFRCIRGLMRALQQEHGQAIDDLAAARADLAARETVLPDRLAVMGLCMGGGFALILAKSGLFRVAAPFYGQAPVSMDGTCPVVASFGRRDRMIEPHARHLEAELERTGVAHDIRHYENAGHSFLTHPPNRIMALLGPWMPARAGYEPVAAADAMQRLLTFLATHL